MSEHHRGFRAIEPHDAFTILLVVPSPKPGYDRGPREFGDRPGSGVASPTERFEAVAGVARAAFAPGGRIVMPGDRGMSPIVAAIALDYASLPAAERWVEPSSPLTVVDTEWPDMTLAALLAPYVMRGAVRHVGPDDEPVRLESGWEERELEPSPQRRQPVAPGLIERWAPAGAVFVSPDEKAEREMTLLEERGIPAVAIAHADPESADRWRHRDSVRGMMSERRRRWLERDVGERPRRRADVEPYAYLAQRLIGEWAR